MKSVNKEFWFVSDIMIEHFRFIYIHWIKYYSFIDHFLKLLNGFVLAFCLFHSNIFVKNSSLKELKQICKLILMLNGYISYSFNHTNNSNRVIILNVNVKFKRTCQVQTVLLDEFLCISRKKYRCEIYCSNTRVDWYVISLILKENSRGDIAIIVINDCGSSLTEHALYSPNLSSSNFLFLQLKTEIFGTKFQSDDVVIYAVKDFKTVQKYITILWNGIEIVLTSLENV